MFENRKLIMKKLLRSRPHLLAGSAAVAARSQHCLTEPLLGFPHSCKSTQIMSVHSVGVAWIRPSAACSWELPHLPAFLQVFVQFKSHPSQSFAVYSSV